MRFGSGLHTRELCKEISMWRIMAGSALSEKRIPCGFLPGDGKGTDKYFAIGAIELSQLTCSCKGKRYVNGWTWLYSSKTSFAKAGDKLGFVLGL